MIQETIIFMVCVALLTCARQLDVRYSLTFSTEQKVGLMFFTLFSAIGTIVSFVAMIGKISDKMF